jgi:hypothetical protein
VEEVSLRKRRSEAAYKAHTTFANAEEKVREATLSSDISTHFGTTVPYDIIKLYQTDFGLGLPCCHRSSIPSVCFNFFGKRIYC